jgi:hypothetical protein
LDVLVFLNSGGAEIGVSRFRHHHFSGKGLKMSTAKVSVVASNPSAKRVRRAQVDDAVFVSTYKKGVENGVKIDDIAIGLGMEASAVKARVTRINAAIEEVNAARVAKGQPKIGYLPIPEGTGRRGRQPLSERINGLMSLLGTLENDQPTE